MITETTKRRPGPQVESSVELVSPAKALEFLGYGELIRQRKLRWSKVARYAKDMRDGLWTVSNDAIAFAFDGALMNGQHRLHAVIEADVTVPMLIVRGLESRAYAVMDRPERRSAADYLHQWLPEDINKSVFNLGALIRAIYRFEIYGSFASSGRTDYVDHEEMLRFATEHGTYLHDILSRTTRRGMKDLGATGTTLGALIWFFSEKDPDDTDEFFNRLGSGAGLAADDPIFVVRQTLVRYRLDPSHRPNQNHMAAIIIIAWNKWRLGESLDSIVWRGGGARPDEFPTIL